MSAPTPLVDLAYRIRTNQLLGERAVERVRIAAADREREYADAEGRDYADSLAAGFVTPLEAP